MRRIPTWLTIVLLLIISLVIKWIYFPGETKKKDNKASGGSNPVSVNYYVVSKSELTEEIKASGKIGAFNEVDLVPEMAGKIIAIYFKEGETVQQGQEMIKLNDSELQAQLQKLKPQIKMQEDKVKRHSELLKIKGISQEDFEAEESQMKVLQAEESLIIAQLAKTVIKAPFSGVVGLKNVSPGAFVNTTNPVASLVQLKPVYIEFSIPEIYASEVKKGMVVEFSCNTSSTSQLKNQALIYAIEPRIDEQSKTIKIRAEYKGDETILPGTYADVSIALDRNGGSLLIPTASIIPILNGQKVMVSRKGKASEAIVKTGIRTVDKIEILEGLQVGDTVITTGLLAVKEGTPLKLVKN